MQFLVQGIVSTLAGNGSKTPFSNGQGTAATFSDPNGVAIDRSGNLFVTEYSSHLIRKITPAGLVSTFAGNGTAAYQDGTGVAASFNSPYGITIDNNDNLYVADRNNYRIRKITPDKVVTTIAGNGTSGLQDGTESAARFNLPRGIDVDSSGFLYIADQSNNAIRKISPAGVVTTLAGNGTSGYTDASGLSARFSAPLGVALDSLGNIIVVESGNHRIRKVSPDGVVTTLAGNGNATFKNGTGTAATFSSPSGLAIDTDDNVYVAEYGNNCIRKITPGTVVTTLVGNGLATPFADGTGTVATFNQPYGLAINSAGLIFVADTNNQRIRIIR
jgi:sugar lactone lactonase YvrE